MLSPCEESTGSSVLTAVLRNSSRVQSRRPSDEYSFWEFPLSVHHALWAGSTPGSWASSISFATVSSSTPLVEFSPNQKGWYFSVCWHLHPRHFSRASWIARRHILAHCQFFLGLYRVEPWLVDEVDQPVPPGGDVGEPLLFVAGMEYRGTLGGVILQVIRSLWSTMPSSTLGKRCRKGCSCTIGYSMVLISGASPSTFTGFSPVPAGPL